MPCKVVTSFLQREGTDVGMKEKGHCGSSDYSGKDKGRSE